MTLEIWRLVAAALYALGLFISVIMVGETWEGVPAKERNAATAALHFVLRPLAWPGLVVYVIVKIAVCRFLVLIGVRRDKTSV